MPEQPLPTSCSNSVRDVPVTSPACLGEEPADTDLAYSWEISGKAQGSEAEHT